MATAATCAGWPAWQLVQSPPWLTPEPGETTAGGCAERLARASLLELGSICLPKALIMGPFQGLDAELPGKSEMERTCPPSPPVTTFHACPSCLKLQARSTVAFKLLKR